MKPPRISTLPKYLQNQVFDMKVVHLCLASFFPDGYSYQENMLPKFHKQQGHDVEVIASLVTFDEHGNPVLMNKPSNYINEHGIPVTRLAYKSPTKIYSVLRRFAGFNEALEKSKPDVLFIHGCQFMDIDVVARYVKAHTDVRVFVDNHADFSNSATNPLSRYVLHGIIWKHCAAVIEPFAAKMYGVLPCRVDFLENVYGMPKEKCELLVMGADDDDVIAADTPEIRSEIRSKYNIADDDFLVITGGKIDQWKTQTLLLMQAVKNIDDPKVKLIVFGSVTEELMPKVKQLADGVKVQYIGWVQSKDSYKYFAVSDLAVFPGRHSVFWEQVAAQGIPMLCKKWDGTTHVDVGGNVKFLTQDSTEEIEMEIRNLTENSQAYSDMKEAAKKGKTVFLYSDISKRSIEYAK